MNKDFSFKSERLSYRGIQREDASVICKWRSDPQNYKHFLNPHPLSIDEHLVWFKKYLNDDTRYDFLILDLNGKAIGTAGLSNISDSSCEISYMIGAMDARGKGYAVEAVKALSTIAFDEFGVEDVFARILPSNVASMKVATGGGSLNVRGSSNYPGLVLLLTNNDNTLPLYQALTERGESLIIWDKELTIDLLKELQPYFIISFNYRHILKGPVIEEMKGRIVNVHCSMLPFNRGASPNFFSFYCNTPKGVTVHELTEGLDRGSILLQTEIPLSDDETFESSYDKLIDEAINLILSNWSNLRDGNIESRPQQGEGSYHDKKEFESLCSRFPFELDERIIDWKNRYGLE